MTKSQRENIEISPQFRTHPDLCAIGDQMFSIRGRSVHDGPEVLDVQNYALWVDDKLE